VRAPSVLLIDNYDSYTWNLHQLIWQVSGTAPTVVRNDEAEADELLASGFTHVVISPGPGTATVPGDFGICADLLRRARIPCLGVCLGHQGIAAVFGGTVEPTPQVMHGRLSTIKHTGDGIFADIPQDFRAVRYHSLAVTNLPRELTVTAHTDDGVIMGLTHRERPLHGVQFHPESVETEFGTRLMANFLGLRRTPHPPAASPVVRSSALGVEITAEQLFIRAFADDPYAFWLDSARHAYGMGRYSYLGSAGGSRRLILRAYADSDVVTEETGQGTTQQTGSVFEHLRAHLTETPVLANASPVPFTGGYIGYLGYGTKGTVGLGRPGGGEHPDAELMRVDRFVAYDHETGDQHMVTVGMSATAHEQWCTAIRNLVKRDKPALAAAEPCSTRLEHTTDRDSYAHDFDQVQRWLRAGDSYEACYTYQITGTCTEDPLLTYRRLRAVNPAPYAAYLRFGDRTVLSSSPERFLTIDAEGWAETKPIKGTAHRDENPDRDAEIRIGLASDEKTRSENLIIADLLRNDLGQVCEVGSVRVPTLMAVESYTNLHQLVTTVRGRLRSDLDSAACVEALFPGGSMTGAPKKRTVELLDELETSERGIYSGCLGFFAFDGQVDQSIVIRTIVREGDRFSIGVGGALTVMSDPDEEFAETQLKANALLRVLGIQQQEPAKVPG
jgi:para-aminobenzoate synthetase